MFNVIHFKKMNQENVVYFLNSPVFNIVFFGGCK